MMLTLLDIDPNLVRPGFTPLLILIGLFIALTLLYLSLRRQLRKIHLPHRDETEEVEEPAQDDAIEGEDLHHDHLEHDPVQHDPVQRDPVQPDPVQPDPVQHDPVQHDHLQQDTDPSSETDPGDRR